MQTLDEALVALKRGEPIHVSGEDAMRLSVILPTVPREDRAEVIERACCRLTAKVTAYPPTIWYPGADSEDLDDLYSGRKDIGPVD